MRIGIRATALACLACAAFAAPSSAGVVFTLTDVDLVAGGGLPAGTLTGSFTLSDDLHTMLAADITASAATVDGFTYASATYTLADATFTYTDQLPYNFRIDLGPTRELQLVFLSGLAATGATNIYTGSYEWQADAGSRTVASGSVVASHGSVPEPSSVVLAAVGASAALLAARRIRRRRAG
ncbi:PEP-CTERM sorting domain-containing protein [Paludisphaera mucosa]|uniref:PEP-CTERM sorting domain-containing protein n=1 Tax=Paludisphaera mucosa TaxID=3030827 RepID=A0ABT6FKM6_9BACT|nr:PEP-CTERM sorting domain-containing protein [Paludisphaera mucosa]MDG3007945.1 PEP-CTERM sorting domain-containing protein [Paludisphaera mucosa]